MKRKSQDSTHRRIFDVIKSLSGQSRILSIPRIFVDFTGSLDTALFLSQLIYWSDKGNEDGWFFKTYPEWETETTLSEYQVRKAANKLKKMGILNTIIKKAAGNPTVHYKLNINNFSDSFLKFLQKRNLKNSRDIYTLDDKLKTITQKPKTLIHIYQDDYPDDGNTNVFNPSLQ